MEFNLAMTWRSENSCSVETEAVLHKVRVRIIWRVCLSLAPLAPHYRSIHCRSWLNASNAELKMHSPHTACCTALSGRSFLNQTVVSPRCRNLQPRVCHSHFLTGSRRVYPQQCQSVIPYPTATVGQSIGISKSNFTRKPTANPLAFLGSSSAEAKL